MQKPLAIIRKSPIIIFKNFVIIEVLAVIAFTIASYLAYYAKIYRAFAISNVIPFGVAELIFIFSVETALMFYIFLRWHRERFIFYKEELVHQSGLWHEVRRQFKYSDISSSSYRRNLFGVLLKYGAVNFDFAGHQPVVFKNISEPEEFLALLAGTGRRPEVPVRSLPELLKEAEHQNLEFKSTFRWDMRAGKVNKELERAVMKTVAAFLNSSGGHLIIGVDDGRNIVGLDNDYKTLNRPDADGFESHFSNIFNQMIGASFRQQVQLAVHIHGGKECAVVRVSPSHTPAYVKDNEEEEFFIRTGNGTTSLRVSEINPYISTRFQ